LFALKPGDSVTGMGGHSWVLEPEAENLKFQMRLIYQHHERKAIIDKVKSYDNPNKWDTVISGYKNAIIKVFSNGEKPRREA